MGLYIAKIKFSRPDGKTSEIDFAKGLTIITGPSDTGKTYIFKAIDFLFGAEFFLKGKEEDSGFVASMGYDTISMELSIGSGSILLTRKIGTKKTDVLVMGDVGDFKTKQGCSLKEMKEFYKKLLGVPEDLKVPSNSDGKSQGFSWRLAKTFCMASEDDIDNERSILLPENVTSRTPYFASLLYFLYELDFTEYIAEDAKKAGKARVSALSNYIGKKQQEIKEKIDATKADLAKNNISEGNIDAIIDELTKELDEMSEQMNAVLSKNNELTQKAAEIQDELTRLNVTQTEYSQLEEQYTSDIKRLAFIVDGQDKYKKNKHQHRNCPFCQSPLPEEKQDPQYVEAAKNELVSVMRNLRELQETENGVASSISEKKEDIKKLEEEKQAGLKRLKEELAPKKQELSARLQQYQDFVVLKKALDLYGENDVQFKTDLEDIKRTAGQYTPFKPMTLFPESFKQEMEDYYLSILKSIGYAPLESVGFSMDSQKFDVIINGSGRSTHGKGFRSLFNSLLVLAFREVMNKEAKINPHFYLIDSPLKGLYLETDAGDTKDLRTNFFAYLASNVGEDQLIVIENTHDAELSKVTKGENVNIIEFTHDTSEGRYGLLYDVPEK